MNLRHLLWIPAGAIISFFASFIFGDRLTLPVDLYYLIYFAVIIGFFAYYVKSTHLDLRALISRRLIWGILLGLAVGFMLIKNVTSRPATERFTGWMLVWAIFWRGIVYGGVDGLLLLAFPWIVVWRALEAESRGFGRKIAAAVIAWGFILLVTTAYHLGYADFRSSKIVQPNVGSTIAGFPTLIAANPVGGPVSHICMHVAAVVHSPRTELFLPPHRASD
ncbi:MAG: hypothetical protein C4524_09030 [Candidatus Zixiibacteriota bacterium]|nr:MAG: hypothetical protein C4524_09030 [candidate division Zixibacteria bacterium]